MTGISVLASSHIAFGGFGGALSGFAPHELAALMARDAISRAGNEAAWIGGGLDRGLGFRACHHYRTERHVSRPVAAMTAGMPQTAMAVAMHVILLCGSGLQAVVPAAPSLMPHRA